MLRWFTVFSSLAVASIMLSATSSGAIAQMAHEGMEPADQQGEFQRIEQPLWLKGAVTAGGLGLIGLELWWFLWSKPKSRTATIQGGLQNITVTVDGGYDPSHIVVQAGQPVRLNFDRKDPSSCLEEVRFPDFRISQQLPLNQVTPIEFTPATPGRYEFTCGMNMFRGVVDVQAKGGETAVLAPTSNLAADLPASIEATPTPAGIQEATVTVAKGYQPKRVIVEAGALVRLRFDRQNPSSCYDQLLIPEFAIAVDLNPDITTVEFTPTKPGEFEFMCGMQMNRGVIEVRPSHRFANGSAAAQIQGS